ncbi:MAG: flagellar hook capping FlgD N-terminal domain-containing protein [Fluviicoccus sp.]|uniref:flagellar hook assembly protein FlgD n=1 Tax=Fluviicoccus sp. TaxID=2003552 RepID=UPI002721EBD5|nr:flagellar hook capping FlgD N-terminal domain-containing protein [Fluviicoccus sp.]MDO8330492.1 flagellar hook capping FlgD N-terminal domain-containing protein [Fluviicoccus sp.]
MAVDAIGSALSATTSDITESRLNQEDFIKLFMTELSFQDPLEPINNREFLAQMAQFANLEQARVTNENMDSLVTLNATAQSLSLLGKQVEAGSNTGNSFIGTITAISFAGGAPVLTIKQADGSVITDIRLSQIQLVR